MTLFAGAIGLDEPGLGIDALLGRADGFAQIFAPHHHDAVRVTAHHVARADDLAADQYGLRHGADGLLDGPLDGDAEGEHRESEFAQFLGVADAGVGDQAAEALGHAGVGQYVAEGPGLGVFTGGHHDDVAGPGVRDGDLEHDVVPGSAAHRERGPAQRHGVVDGFDLRAQGAEPALCLVDGGGRVLAQPLDQHRVGAVEFGVDAQHGSLSEAQERSAQARAMQPARLGQDGARSREGDAEVAKRSVGRAVDHRHPLRFEQVAGESLVVTDLLPCRGAPAEQPAAAHEHVEAAARRGAGQAGDVGQQLHRLVPPGLVDGDAVADEALVAGERGGRGGLADRRGAGRDLRLQLVDGADQLRRARAVADPPAGHGVGLGDAIGEEHPLGQARFDSDDGGGQPRLVPDLVVDLVGEHQDVGVGEQHLGEGAEFAGGVGGARGVVGGVEDDPARRVGDRRFQPLWRELESVGLGAGDDDRCAVVGEHHVRVGHPVRGRDDDLVAGVQGGRQGEVDDLLRPAAHGDPVHRVAQPVAGVQLVGDGGAQLRSAVDGRVLGLAAPDGLDRGGLDVVGGVEVGLADSEVEDLVALRLEFAYALGGGSAGRGLDAVDPLGEGHQSARRSKLRPPGTWKVGMISRCPMLTWRGEPTAYSIASAMSSGLSDS